MFNNTTASSFSYFGLIIVLLFTLFAGLAFGAIDISFNHVLEALLPVTDITTTNTAVALGNSNTYIGINNTSNIEQQVMHRIIWDLRFPRVILAFLAGCGLAISGLVLQTVTRNPLADPYLFGISSGASFGVVVLITLFGASASSDVFANEFSMPLAAFIGSLVAMFCMLAIAGKRQSQQVESMLLTGVALTFLFSSFTSLLLYLTDPQAVSAILFWTLGSFSRAQWSELWFPSIVISVCLLIILAHRRQLNAMVLGDESATTLGINVRRFRLHMLVLSSLITATLVAMCGGIGFVGLMIPHIVRYFISQGTLLGMTTTTLAGGIFMVWVDVFSRDILSNQELPIGIITSASGSLFFLALLYFRKSRPS